MGGGTRRAAVCAADNFCIRVIAGPAPDGGGGTRRAAVCAADNFCIRVIWGPAPAGVYAKHKEPCGYLLAPLITFAYG